MRVEWADTLENRQLFLAHNAFSINIHVACPRGQVLFTESRVREVLGSHFTDSEMNLEGFLFLDQGHLVAGGTRISESGASDARSQVHHGGDTCLSRWGCSPGQVWPGRAGDGGWAWGLPLPLPAFLQCSLGTCWAPGSAWMLGVMGSWRTACASPRGLTIDPEMDLTP